MLNSLITQHNVAVGGSPGSMYLYFNAIDFSVKDFTTANYSHLIYRINARNYITNIECQEENRILTPSIMCIGFYPDFIHIDTRGLLSLASFPTFLSNSSVPVPI